MNETTGVQVALDRCVRYLDHITSPMAALAVVALLGGTAALDAATGPEASFSIFYLLPVVVATLARARPWGVAAAIVAAGLWLSVEQATSPPYTSDWFPLWNGAVRLGFFVAVALLIDALAESRRHEAAAARTDPVSGLLNRVGFMEAAQREVERARRGGGTLVFAYIDVDDFKLINDTYGHRIGDAVLRSLGGACHRSLRSLDIAGRVGGDEFALCMPDTGLAGARLAMERLRRDVAGRSHAPLALSIGVAEFAVPPGSVEEALERVDAIMYEAKAVTGKDHTAVRRIEALPD